MNTSQFAPAPRRKGRLVLTLAGSLLFHGSLIGVAALWPTHPVISTPMITVIDDPPPGVSEDKPALPPEMLPTEPDPVQPEFKLTEPTDDPPPATDPSIDEMSLSTPVPPSVPRTAARPATVAATTRPVHASGTLTTTGSPATGGTAGSAGSGVRWNKPKPAYPAAHCGLLMCRGAALCA